MSPRTAEQNQALRDSTRGRILKAAMGVFSRHGYETASVRMIAEEAGIAQGLMYSHFKGKQDLLKALFDRNMQDVRESFAAAAGPPVGEAAPPLERLIRSAVSIVGRNMDFWRLSYGVRMQAAVVKALGPALQGWTRDILGTLEIHFRASGSGQPQVDAALFFASLDGVCQHFVLDPKRYPIEAVAEALIARFADPREPRKPQGVKHARRRP